MLQSAGVHILRALPAATQRMCLAKSLVLHACNLRTCVYSMHAGLHFRIGILLHGIWQQTDLWGCRHVSLFTAVHGLL